MIGRGSQTIHVDAEITARKNGNDIISRRHAEIVRLNDGSYQIQDLGALNGTFVNSERVTKKILFNNDIVQFGGLSARPKGEDQWSVKYVFHTNYVAPRNMNSGGKGDVKRDGKGEGKGEGNRKEKEVGKGDSTNKKDVPLNCCRR